MELRQPTSERVDERFARQSAEKYLIYLIHRATYIFSMGYLHSKDVLDYGCGTGYGTAMVANCCKSIVGVDISAEAITYALKTYAGANISFQLIGDVTANPTPFHSGSFDVVISFQVIEHIEDARKYLLEIERVLKDAGILIVATPNRDTRLFPRQKPWNVFHVREYNAGTLVSLLSEFFGSVELFHLGGTDRILRKELRRTALARWIALPFTLGFVPDGIRLGGLRLLGKAKDFVRKISNAKTAHRRFDFDDTDVLIGPSISPSLDLIAVASKRIAGSVT